MRKYLLSSSAVIFLFGCALWALSRSATPAVEVWKITSLNWEPYSSAEMTTQGNAIQDLRLLLKEQGIELQVEYYPWKRARKIAREEGYLGYFPAWPTEVDEGFIASDAVFHSPLAILSKPNSPIRYTNLKDMSSEYKIGFIKTYDYSEPIQAILNTQKKTGATTDLALLKMLLSGQVDVAIADPLVFQYLAEKHGLGDIQIIHKFGKVPLVLAVYDNPDNKKKLARFNKMLRERK